jgi:hypothetical protein
MIDSLFTIIFAIKVIAIIFNAALVVFAVYVFSKAYEMRPDIMGAPAATHAATAATKRSRAVQEAWALIEQQAARGSEGQRLAVIDADRLVDKLLKDAGYEGEGALERMKQLPGERIASLNDLFAAHRFRNRLVHEVGFAPREQDIVLALDQFRAFLREVGYLE